MNEEIYFIDNSDSASNQMFSFEGRICRKDFWKTILKVLGIGFLFSLVFVPCGFASPVLAAIFLFILISITSLIICAATSKRFHDIGYSAAIPVTSALINYILFFTLFVLEMLGMVRSSLYEMLSVISLVAGGINMCIIYIVGGIIRGNKGMNIYGSNPVRDYDEQLREYNGTN